MNHDLFRFPAGQHLRTIGAVLLGCLGLVQLGHAAGASVAAQDSAFARFMSTTVGAGQETISFSSNGTPVLTPSTPTIAVESGQVNATRTGGIRMPSGQALPVTGKAKIPGSAIGSIIKKALPLVGPLAVGIAIYDVAKELGFTPQKNADGSVSVSVADPLRCSTAPCYQYAVYIPGFTNSPQYTTGQGVCVAAWPAVIAWLGSNRVTGSPTFQVTASNGYEGACFGMLDGGYKSITNVSRVGNQLPPADSTPSTDQALADAIANKIGWPDSSAVARALDQAQRATGDTIPTEGPKVSGPPSLTGPKSVTTTPIPNGTRETTKQTNYNCTYVDGATVMDGGTVACSETVTSTDKDTVTNPSTGVTTTTSTQTSQTTSPADTAGSKPPEMADPCDKNPDRAGCSTLDTPTEPIPKTTKSITYTPEVLFGNGVCPANRVMTSHGQTFTVWDWQQTCSYTTNYVRPIVLIICAFVAMMILVPRSE